jgi:hypothetical protein
MALGTAGPSLTPVGLATVPDAEMVTPATTCCAELGKKCGPNPAQWETATWDSLQFDQPDPHWFR